MNVIFIVLTVLVLALGLYASVLFLKKVSKMSGPTKARRVQLIARKEAKEKAKQNRKKAKQAKRKQKVQNALDYTVFSDMQDNRAKKKKEKQEKKRLKQEKEEREDEQARIEADEAWKNLGEYFSKMFKKDAE
jgi:hypothetical protein